MIRFAFGRRMKRWNVTVCFMEIKINGKPEVIQVEFKVFNWI
jgi:hypothetical protein